MVFSENLTQMANTFIYALCEPGTRTVKYIGKSDNPEYRFKQHLRQSVRAKTHLGNWLRSLAEKPALVVLREIPDELRGIAEERYIRLARGLGMKLVNGTDGGDGLHNPLPEVREKIASSLRGQKRSDESKAKMSAARKGRPATEAEIEANRFSHIGEKNPMFGQSHTPEACAKISATHKGKPKTAEHNAKNSAAQKGVPKTPEHNAKNSAAQQRIWDARKEQAAITEWALAPYTLK